MAVKKKEREAQAGAPLWMVTYGDMVTLLLAFFVMLLAMSEVKKDDTFLDFMQAIRDAFGYIGGAQQTPLDPVEIPRNVDLKQMLIIPIQWHDFAKSEDPGVVGEYAAVTNMRRPEIFDVGGKIHFLELDATLSDENRAKVAEFAGHVRGHMTQLRVSVHCSREPVEGTEFADHFELTHARAHAVMLALVEAGIDRGRIVILAAGPNEPITSRAYTDQERAQNDLVQVLQIDIRVDEFSNSP